MTPERRKYIQGTRPEEETTRLALKNLKRFLKESKKHGDVIMARQYTRLIGLEKLRLPVKAKVKFAGTYRCVVTGNTEQLKPDIAVTLVECPVCGTELRIKSSCSSELLARGRTFCPFCERRLFWCPEPF